MVEYRFLFEIDPCGELGKFDDSRSEIRVYLPNIRFEAEALVEEGFYGNLEDALVDLLTGVLTHETIHYILNRELRGNYSFISEEAIVMTLELLSCYFVRDKARLVKSYFKDFMLFALTTITSYSNHVENAEARVARFLKKLEDYITRNL